MTKFRRILFPTDFSENASTAREYACSLAEENSAELHVLHVIDEADYFIPTMGEFVAPPSMDVDTLRDAAQESLDRAIDPTWAKANRVIPEIRFGAPFLEIIRHARERSIDLIVMSTHGRTGLSHLLMGSVAENVVRMAPCPVLTVHPADHAFVVP